MSKQNHAETEWLRNFLHEKDRRSKPRAVVVPIERAIRHEHERRSSLNEYCEYNARKE